MFVFSTFTGGIEKTDHISLDDCMYKTDIRIVISLLYTNQYLSRLWHLYLFNQTGACNSKTPALSNPKPTRPFFLIAFLSLIQLCFAKCEICHKFKRAIKITQWHKLLQTQGHKLEFNDWSSNIILTDGTWDCLTIKRCRLVPAGVLPPYNVYYSAEPDYLIEGWNVDDTR